MIVLEKLQKIESGLSTLRFLVLVLSFGLLFFTLFNSNHDIIVSLVISFIAGLLYTQKHLAPATYKLFILILMIDCIYCGGHFTQIIFSREPLTFAFVLINFYTVCVIALFIVVIWRHYQLCMATEHLEFVS